MAFASKIAQLFGVQVPAISKHLKKIFETGELDEKVVVSILESNQYNIQQKYRLFVGKYAFHWL
jgi:hypothetical protein